MEKLDIRSIIVTAEEVFLLLQNAKQTILQGLEVQTDRKLQGCLVKAEELIKRLHLIDRQANPDDYKCSGALKEPGELKEPIPNEEENEPVQGTCQATESKQAALATLERAGFITKDGQPTANYAHSKRENCDDMASKNS